MFVCFIVELLFVVLVIWIYMTFCLYQHNYNKAVKLLIVLIFLWLQTNTHNNSIIQNFLYPFPLVGFYDIHGATGRHSD